MMVTRLPQLMNVRQIAMLWVLGDVRCAKTINHRLTDIRIIVLKCLFLILSQASREFLPLFGCTVPLETASSSCDSQPSRSTCSCTCGCEMLFKAACASVAISSGVFPHMRFTIPQKEPFLTVFTVVRQGSARTSGETASEGTAVDR